MTFRTTPILALVSLLIACTSTSTITSRPAKLPNGERGFLIEHCPSRDACVTYAREQICSSGMFHIRQQQVKTQPDSGVAYALRIECA